MIIMAALLVLAMTTSLTHPLASTVNSTANSGPLRRSLVGRPFSTFFNFSISLGCAHHAQKHIFVYNHTHTHTAWYETDIFLLFTSITCAPPSSCIWFSSVQRSGTKRTVNIQKKSHNLHNGSPSRRRLPHPPIIIQRTIVARILYTQHRGLSAKRKKAVKKK